LIVPLSLINTQLSLKDSCVFLFLGIDHHHLCLFTFFLFVVAEEVTQLRVSRLYGRNELMIRVIIRCLESRN